MNKNKISFIVFLFLLFVLPGVAKAESYKYFGYFQPNCMDTNCYDTTKDYSTVVWIGSSQYDTGNCSRNGPTDTTCKMDRAVADGKKIILQLRQYMFFDAVNGYGELCSESNGCQHSWQFNWNNYKEIIRPYVKNGSIAALLLFDEPVFYTGDNGPANNRTMYNAIATVIPYIKADPDFANVPIMVNLLPQDIVRLPNFPQFGEPSIPPGIDWLGFDCYSDWNNCYGSGLSIPQLVSALKGKISSSQKIFLVPDAFAYVDVDGSGNILPPTSAQLNNVLSIADNYFQLAQGDSQITGVFPFWWQSYTNHWAADKSGEIRNKYANIGYSLKPAPPTLQFTASPLEVNSGEASTLSWKLTGIVDHCSIGGAWGPLTQYERQYLTPGTHTQTTGAITSIRSYTMSCAGPGGTTDNIMTTVKLITSNTNTTNNTNNNTTNPTTSSNSTTTTTTNTGINTTNTTTGQNNLTSTPLLNTPTGVNTAVSNPSNLETVAGKIAGLQTKVVAFLSARNSLSNTQYSARLQEIILELLNIQSELQQMSGSGSAATGFRFLRDLSLGQANADIGQLQRILRNEGILSTYSQNIFDQATYLAVIAFQRKYGINPTGYVGPITRNKLNSLLGR